MATTQTDARTISREYCMWAHRRIHALYVASDTEDLRALRNKFGLASVGRGVVTPEDCDEVERLVYGEVKGREV